MNFDVFISVHGAWNHWLCTGRGNHCPQADQARPPEGCLVTLYLNIKQTLGTNYRQLKNKLIYTTANRETWNRPEMREL